MASVNSWNEMMPGPSRLGWTYTMRGCVQGAVVTTPAGARPQCVAAPPRHVWQMGAASPAGRTSEHRGLPFQRLVSLRAAHAVIKGDDGAGWVTNAEEPAEGSSGLPLAPAADAGYFTVSIALATFRCVFPARSVA